MEARVNIHELTVPAIKALYALEAYLASTQLSKGHRELIKIRASQINSCAYCIDMHTKDALKQGETAQRLFLISAWRETHLFSGEEKVVLAVTEEITLIHRQGLSEATYNKAKEYFDDHYIAQMIIAIVSINAWNRIAVSTHMQVAG